MVPNLEKYKKDLNFLVSDGEALLHAIQFECNPKEFENHAKKILGRKFHKFKDNIPSFLEKYQAWYSESLAIIKLLLPDRLSDFIKLYEKPTKGRKEITYGNYVIEDYLQGLTVTRGLYKEKVVGPDAAIPLFRQQLNILKSVRRRFESSLLVISSSRFT